VDDHRAEHRPPTTGEQTMTAMTIVVYNAMYGQDIASIIIWQNRALTKHGIDDNMLDQDVLSCSRVVRGHLTVHGTSKLIGGEITPWSDLDDLTSEERAFCKWCEKTWEFEDLPEREVSLDEVGARR